MRNHTESWHVSPRSLSAAWAVWASLTAAAYIEAEPYALGPVLTLTLGVPLSAVWGVTATLLIVGAALPSRGRAGVVARRARVVGIMLVAGLLAAWASTYMLDSLGPEGGRMWVSGKNYLALTLAALGSAARINRPHTGAEVQPE